MTPQEVKRKFCAAIEAEIERYRADLDTVTANTISIKTMEEFKKEIQKIFPEE